MYTHAHAKKKTDTPKRRCHRCHGSGRAACTTCGGAGRVQKGKDFYFKPLFGRCDACYGTRTRGCAACSGGGFI